MRFLVNHFEEKDGQRVLDRSQVFRAKNALKAICQYLFPEAPVYLWSYDGVVGTKCYAEYRCGTTLVRAVVYR